MEHPVLSAKPKLLFVGDSQPRQQQLLEQLDDQFEVVQVRSPLRALSRLARESFAGLYVAAEHLGDAFQIGKLLQNERILEGMPDGVVLLDADNTIIWGNGRLREWTERENVDRRELLRRAGQPRNSGPRLLSVPHGAGHRARPAARRCVRATTATSRCMPRRSAKATGRRST